MQATRRAFLGIAIVIGAGGAALLLVDSGGRVASRRGFGELVVALRDPSLASARRVGRAWLRANPSLADRSALEQSLAPLPSAVREAASPGDPAVVAWLRERQREDFAEGRVVKVEGWWLSLSEARFCGYLALA